MSTQEVNFGDCVMKNWLFLQRQRRRHCRERQKPADCAGTMKGETNGGRRIQAKPKAHRLGNCSVPGCVNHADFEVFLYDYYSPLINEEFFKQDYTCPFICESYMIENEQKAIGLRKPRGLLHTHTQIGILPKDIPSISRFPNNT